MDGKSANGMRKKINIIRWWFDFLLQQNRFQYLKHVWVEE